MNIDKANAIFMQINREDIADNDKITAIKMTVEMPMHMGIKIVNLLGVIRFLLDKNARLEHDNEKLRTGLQELIAMSAERIKGVDKFLENLTAEKC
ncbi:MAG: hypothetical protein FWH20_00405 [Oscillospiraceae bacterium]|nr:hypothetical protein [Oscillospiraceae bacterium]